METIKFICRTCEDYNKQNMGMPQYLEQQTEFHSFTDAWLHLEETYLDLNHSTHYVDAVLEQK